jgi:4-amino-4-deoxy-L-arabinose transferase-like glycosyltransferase
MRHMNLRRITELHYRQFLIVLLGLAFLIRVTVRVAFGESYFWTNGYSAYYDLAENVVSGKGFCFGTTCAYWPPLYPLFLALTALGGKHYLLIVIPQALMGAGTALCAFLIGRNLFSTFVGMLACAITAIYPYYVMHDTALQETGMVTFLTALSVFLLLRAGKLNKRADWFLAGLALGLIALTRASVAPAAGVALIWIAVWGTRGSIHDRLLKTSLVLLAILVMVGPWLIRTYRLTGAAVLSSQTGSALWKGNNPQTFSAYPKRSIDISTDTAWTALPDADKAELEGLGGDEIKVSDWYARRALLFIRTHPWLTIQGGFRKLVAAFSWRLNPVREPLAQTSYATLYMPISILGAIGFFLGRRNRGVILIGMLFIAFMTVTAVFWAHTSHRSYLDVYLIVLAASVVDRLPGWIETRKDIAAAGVATTPAIKGL